MKAAYAKAMDGVYLLCVAVAGLCLVVMTTVIPVGVYWRYVLNSALAWPEPLAVLLVVLFTFVAAAACYRARVHMRVALVTDRLSPSRQRLANWAAELFMAALSLFMVIWGGQLVQTTWHQVVGEFPFLSVGVTYMPIPIGGAITLLFIIERVWIGPPPPGSFVYREPVSVD
jgi:TRAP-type C4-dicarboxylate transport system permease small subunit